MLDKRIIPYKAYDDSIGFVVDITKQINELFGFNVKKAIYNSNMFDVYVPNDKEEKEQALTFCEMFLSDIDDCNKLNINNGTVVVQFKNGNIISFYNNERGHLKKEDRDNIIAVFERD